VVRIIEYNKIHNDKINSLVNEIAAEFVEPISSSSKKTSTDEYWLAFDKDTLVGTVGVNSLSNNSAVLVKMFVKIDYRGEEKGISSILLQMALEWAMRQGVRNVFLGTMSQFKAAQKFYEKHGFERIEVNQLPSDFIKNPIDDIYYRKSLPQIE